MKQTLVNVDTNPSIQFLLAAVGGARMAQARPADASVTCLPTQACQVG